MKFYKSITDGCTNINYFQILEIIDGRSLIGTYPGYLCILFFKMKNKYTIINMDIMYEAVSSCDVETLTKNKLNEFLNKDLTLIDRIIYMVRKYKVMHYTTSYIKRQKDKKVITFNSPSIPDKYDLNKGVKQIL